MERDDSIFRRFFTPPRRTESHLRIFEVPFHVRPQTDPQADVRENLGFGFSVASQPFKRTFGSLGFDVGRMRWRPSDPSVTSAEVKQFDANQSVNIWVARTFVISFGLGLGIIDGLVTRNDGTFEHTIVPYIPVRLGVSVSLWDKVFLGLRMATTPFFGEGHQVGQTRLLLGLGWVY